MERLRQSLADAARDEAKKRVGMARDLRWTIVGKRKRMRAVQGVDAVLRETALTVKDSRPRSVF